jgi:hypothetical protein
VTFLSEPGINLSISILISGPSEGFSVLLGTKSLLAKPSEINIHTVSHSEGVEVVNALRGKGTSKKKGE